MLCKKLLLVFITIPCALCWKPIAAPNAFAIDHPSLGAENTADDATASASHSVTYHGNQFLDENSSGHSQLLFNEPFEGGSAEDEKAVSLGQKLFGSSYYGGGDSCSVDKYAFEADGTIEYQHSMPKLEQFTMCTWMRFANHTGDHVMFTYGVKDEPREIQFWIANAKGSSFISMAIRGQSLYRLNYPLKMRVWHHACTSWNGKTGEWQLWVKGERVGRGFHNRIVGHKIQSSGHLYSGGQSFTGPVSDGLHFEISLLQMYNVALSAGKAHRDHKHHHVHHFDHEGPITSTPAPAVTPPAQPALPSSPHLANGQISTRFNFNLAQPPQPAPQPNNPALPVQGLPSQIAGGIVPQTVTTQFVNGQFHTGGRFLQEQLVTGNFLQGKPQLLQISSRGNVAFPGPSVASPTSFSEINNPANVQYIDSSNINSHPLFKREETSSKVTASFGDKIVKKRETNDDDKTLKKRALVQLSDGSIVDDAAEPFIFDGLAQFGAQSFKDDISKRTNLEDEIKEHDREPAEDEVRAVLNLCSKCDVEPFQGASVFAWKDLRISMNHALKAKSLGGCGEF